MSYSVDQEPCSGCGTCVDVCPAEAIECGGGSAAIDDYLCTLCGACQAYCPQKAVLYEGKPYQPHFMPPGDGSGEMPSG